MTVALTLRDPIWDATLRQIPEDLIDPRDHPRLIFTLESVAEGKTWSDICLQGLSHPEYIMLKRRSPEFLSLAKEAEKIRSEIHQGIREEAAQQRAVVGETIPVFSYKGEQVGEYKKASDKLLEFLMKAGDPAKYRETKAGEGAGKVTLNVQFAIPSRVQNVTIQEGEIISEEEIKTEDAGKLAAPVTGDTGHSGQPATAKCESPGPDSSGPGPVKLEPGCPDSVRSTGAGQEIGNADSVKLRGLSDPGAGDPVTEGPQPSAVPG